MFLSDMSIRRPVFAWMMMVAMMLFGYVSFTRLGISQLPDVDFPVVSVNLSWEGAAPEVMETDVVDIIEDSLVSIQGVRNISSSIRQGQATITLEMELNREIDVVVQEVQTKISQAQRTLPKDIDPPVVLKVNPEDQPIIWLTATTDGSLRDLMDFVQNHLKDRFTTINGVGEVFLGGYVERNLRVWIDQKKLNDYQLTVSDVAQAIGENHREIPAGRIETSEKEINIRAMGEAFDVNEFGNILIAKRSGAPIYKPIYIKDIARVEDGLADVRRISRTAGRQAVGFGVRKQHGFNEVAVGKRVLARLEEVKKELPPGMYLDLVIDRTIYSRQAINELTHTMILSALITSLVCWMFLGSWSATANVLMSIPTSVLGTFMIMYFLGFTLNTFTLLGLSLAIGILVDDEIMILENIVRFRQRGFDKIEGARQGTSQIAPAAIAASIAIIAIFLPVAFMTGIMGKFFYQFGVVISVAVALSLFGGLTFTPMRCSQFLYIGERKTAFGRGVDNTFTFLADFYRRALTWTLKHRWLVVIFSLVVFIASLQLVNYLRKEFVPSQDQSMIFVRLQTPEGSSLEYTSEKYKIAEKLVMERPEVIRYFSAIGGFFGGEVNSGILFITLKDKNARPVVAPFTHRPSQNDIMGYFRKELNKIPDVKAIVQDLSLSSFSAQRGFPVEFSILGSDRTKLAELSKEIQKRMKETQLMQDVDSDYQEGVTEVRVFPDRVKAAEHGVSIETIGETINALMAGERVAKYTQGGRRYDVRIKLEREQALKPEEIENMWVWNNRGELVQLKDVVTIKENPTALTITRNNRERSISIFANIVPGKSQSDAVAAVRKITKEVLPETYRVRFSGNAQTFKESFESLSFVLLMGILVAYMVLASQFNSLKDPLIILLSLPFSVTGALVALKLTNNSLNMYSFVAIILLMGIVKKNSIILVDFTNHLRQQGKKVNDAILEAGPIRLRPILMTSVATLAAAIPPALSWGAGSEVMAPMSVAVIGGIIVSTFFTLLVVPAVYSLTSRDKK